MKEDKKFLPMISVVIPTLNRKEPLFRVLRYFLELETYPFFEIIIIDQGEHYESAIAEFISSITKKDKIRYVKVNYKSLTKARNDGIKLAMGEIVVFIDDDAEPLPGYLEAHAAAHGDPKITAVTGPVLDKQDQRLLSRDDIGIREFEDITKGRKTHFRVDFPYAANWALGGNTSYKKEIFEKLGGFDENFYGGCLTHDDAEFSHRLKKAGGMIYYAPSACIVHQGESSGGCRDLLGKTQYVRLSICNIDYFWFKIDAPAWYRYWVLCKSFRTFVCTRAALNSGSFFSYTLFFLLGIWDGERLIRRVKNMPAAKKDGF